VCASIVWLQQDPRIRAISGSIQAISERTNRTRIKKE
jgi:hypothetical protein